MATLSSWLVGVVATVVMADPPPIQRPDNLMAPPLVQSPVPEPTPVGTPASEPEGTERPHRERGLLRREPGTPVLLPSLGYFGGIAANHLVVPVDGAVSELRLRARREHHSPRPRERRPPATPPWPPAVCRCG